MSMQMIMRFPQFQQLIPVAKGFAAGLGTALLAALIFASEFRISHAVTEAPVPTLTAGEFTGTYEDGVPVYRLPPIEITARRVTH
jgi:hypothetical protein